MSYVEQITHYYNRTSKWHVSHWKTKWEGDSKAIITWTRVDMMQERPVPEWSWENITESAAKALIKKEKLEKHGPQTTKVGYDTVKVPKKRGRPKKQ